MCTNASKIICWRLLFNGSRSFMYSLHFDGLFRKSRGKHTTGFMGFGWLIYHNLRVVAQGYGVAAQAHDATSGIAEYLALVDGLEMLHDLDINREPIQVYGDARVVMDQMLGQAQVHGRRVLPYYDRACRLRDGLNIEQWVWVPRQYNKDADALTRRALRDFKSDQVEFRAIEQLIHREQESRTQRKSRLHILSGMLLINPEGMQALDYSFPS
jgi:ribonuclease HI